MDTATPMNPAMQRGVDLEPEARKAFEEMTGLKLKPTVIFHPEHKFMMASLDGLTVDGKIAVEIKCPGQRTHSIAMDGEVPKHYIPQLQHQLACLGSEMLWYFSYDPMGSKALKVYRDDKYIAKLIEKEIEFWDCVQRFVPPPMSSKDYESRDGAKWSLINHEIVKIDLQINELKQKRDAYKNECVSEAQGVSCKGGGITLTRTFPKGRIDYPAIPELSGVDLDKYRKEPREVWTLRTSSTETEMGI